MPKIQVNYLTNWEYLPWINIDRNITRLQNKIYKAAKECNLKRVQNLQAYIVNSNDIKLIAIQYVSQYISEYYTDYSKCKFTFQNSDKWIIYQAMLSNYICDKYIEFIIDIVEQYIIYICIKPEWEAKLEAICRSHITYDTDTNYLHRLSRYIKDINIFGKMPSNKFSLEFKINNVGKYIDIGYLINRVQTIPYINKFLYNLFNYQNIPEFFMNNMYAINMYKYYLYNLNKLLYRIINCGLQWYTILSQSLGCNDLNRLNNIYVFTTYNQSFFVHNNKLITQNLLEYIVNNFLYASAVNKLDQENIRKHSKKINPFILTDYIITNTDRVKIQINSYRYAEFFDQIRYILYHKTIFKKSKNNFALNFARNTKKIKAKIQYFCVFHYPFINYENLYKFLRLVYMIIYKFIRHTKYNVHTNSAFTGLLKK